MLGPTWGMKSLVFEVTACKIESLATAQNGCIFRNSFFTLIPPVGTSFPESGPRVTLSSHPADGR
jgi:hypothetical protein